MDDSADFPGKFGTLLIVSIEAGSFKYYLIDAHFSVHSPHTFLLT